MKAKHSFADDIAAWKDGAAQVFERASRMKEQPDVLRSKHVRLDGLDALKLYALLAEFIAPRPNGLMTVLIHGMPVDNVVWWDFALCAPGHLVVVMNGVNGLVAVVYQAPEGFAVEQFLTRNCERHRARLQRRVETFERHEVYANAFYSYRRIAEWLRSELKSVDDTPPSFKGGIREDEETMRAEVELLKAYGPTAIRCHVLAKNLLINSAFMCEALVTTLLRIGAAGPLVREPDVLRPLLRSPFMQKVEVLHAYTILFAAKLDVNAPAVKQVRLLMEKRNKLVHAEESEHTRLDDVYFDGNFPLYGGGGDGQIVDFYKRTFLLPSRVDAMDALDVAEKFVAFVMQRIRNELRDEIKFVLDQPQLGYNTMKRVYSVPFSSTTFQSFVVLKRDAVRAETAASQPGVADEHTSDEGET